jgi:hypothetical protein
MPVSAQQYIASLPEFDAKIFKRVTGIDIEKPNHECQCMGIKFCQYCGAKLLKN